MRHDADVIVVGAGIAGLSAARDLAARGRDVLLLERFRVGHGNGSSGGPTRIFRLAYDHPRYVRMARLALERWRALESAAGEPVVVTTGGLDLGPHARLCEDAMRSVGESFSRPTAAAIRERWPALLVEDGEDALVHEEAGVCLADAAIAATARVARAAGVRIEEETVVERIRIRGDRASVVAAGAELTAPVCVVAAGAWAAGLLADLDIRLPVSVTQEQVTFFALRTPAAMPTLIEWPAGGVDGPYAMPDPRIPGSFKAALHHAGPVVTPDTRTFEPDPERIRRIQAFAARRFADHEPTGVTDTCLYTSTSDQDFVLDRRGPIVVASPCSGHGFKFGPLLGELIADLATGDDPTVPLVDFGLDRASLAG